MNGMLLLGLAFGFLFGMAIAFLIAARIKKSAIEDIKYAVRRGLTQIVKTADAKQGSDFWWLARRVERWIPKEGMPWPPFNWPDPPYTKRTRGKER